MTGGICVDLEALPRTEVIGWLQQPRAERDGFFVRRPKIIDPQVQMYLLWRPVGPLQRNVVGCELNPDPPLTIHRHAVPVVFGVDRPTQESSPERAHGVQVSSVENDDRSRDLHDVILGETGPVRDPGRAVGSEGARCGGRHWTCRGRRRRTYPHGPIGHRLHDWLAEGDPTTLGPHLPQGGPADRSGADGDRGGDHRPTNLRANRSVGREDPG